MIQEVFIHTKLDEKGKPIVELRYQGKIKTFRSNTSINRFLGIYNGLEYEPVVPELYVVNRMHEAWNGGIEMTPEEWCKCVRAIVLYF